jgi:hypothetical protein
MTAEKAPETGHGASTPGQVEARRTITRTTITPAPGTVVPEEVKPPRPSLRERLNRPSHHGELNPALEPYAGTKILRLVMTGMLSAMCLLTIAGSVLMLMLWQQNQDSGVLTTQIDRTWELFDYLRVLERWLAFGVVPVVLAWIVLATINVRRATGQRRNPAIAAASFVVGVTGAWVIGATQVAEADGPIPKAVGIAIQAALLAIPLIVMERVAEAAEARHRPLRATYVIAVVFIAHLQGLGGLSTTEATKDADSWGRLGAYLLIGGLIQVLGTLSANEAARAIEEGTQHRYELRHRFGEALLAQAQRQG